MLSSSRILLILLLAFANSAFAATSAEQCALVNCDCDVFNGSEWQNDCQAKELVIAEQCNSSGGKLQSYCGMHGPAAYPVATSIQQRELNLIPKDNSKSLQKQVETQNWSVNETHKTLRRALELEEFGKAIQLVSLLEKDVVSLYELQKQVVKALLDEKEAKDAKQKASEYAAAGSERAQKLNNFSSELWQKIAVANAVKEQRAYKILSFKMARTAATAFEFSADMYADAKLTETAAKLWQQSAAIAQTLIGWESITDNNPKHVKFYQAQASSRWHRATYYWLRANNQEMVVASSQQAERFSSEQSAKNVMTNVQTDELHTVDQGDMRAIKRGQ